MNDFKERSIKRYKVIWKRTLEIFVISLIAEIRDFLKYITNWIG